MRLLFTFLMVFILTLEMKAQFSGYIIYDISFDKNKNIPISDLQYFFGDKRYFFIEKSNYKNISQGELKVVNIYRNDSSKIYNIYQRTDTVFWINTKSDSSKVLSLKLETSEEVILGYKCDKLILKTDLETTTFFFNRQYHRINASKFKNHKYAHWYLYLNKSGAIPLKIVHEYRNFTMILEAIKVESKKLSIDFFDIPKNMMLKEEPTAIPPLGVE